MIVIGTPSPGVQDLLAAHKMANAESFDQQNAEELLERLRNNPSPLASSRYEMLHQVYVEKVGKPYYGRHIGCRV